MSFGGGSGGSPVWSAWSWSNTWNCWERYRWNNDKWEYDYDSVTPPPAVFNTPRGSDPSNMLSSLAPQMGGLNLGPSSAMGYAGPSRTTYPPTGIAPMNTSVGTTIRTRNAHVKAEEFDKRFKQFKSKEFQFGRILKIMWFEPYGSTGTEITVDASYDKSALRKPRRFVIVDTRKGHSICLPIFTYGGQATFKPGCHPEDHAVIYSSKKPHYLPGESDQITKRSIKCIMDGPEHKLDPASRINYAKLYTVEHNVKVWFVGRVSTDHEQKVVVDYNETHPGLADRPTASGVSSAEFTRNAEGGDPSYSLHATPQAGGGPLYGTSMPSSSTAPLAGGQFDAPVSSSSPHGDQQFGTTAQNLDGSYLHDTKPY